MQINFIAPRQRSINIEESLCICNEDRNVNMLGCDNCNQWYVVIYLGFITVVLEFSLDMIEDILHLTNSYVVFAFMISFIREL